MAAVATRAEKKNAFMRAFPYRCFTHNFNGVNTDIIRATALELNIPAGMTAFSYNPRNGFFDLSFGIAIISARTMIDVDYFNLVLDKPLIQVPSIWDNRFTVKILDELGAPQPSNIPALNGLTSSMRRAIRDNFHTQFEF